MSHMVTFTPKDRSHYFKMVAAIQREAKRRRRLFRWRTSEAGSKPARHTNSEWQLMVRSVLPDSEIPIEISRA